MGPCSPLGTKTPGAKPIHGYFLSEIETGPDGDELDRVHRAGLCAYPAKPGDTGDNIICITVAPGGKRPVGAGPAVFAGLPPRWSIYLARYEDIGEPVTDWPNEGELQDRFRIFSQLSPEKGRTKAWEILDQVARR